MIPRGLFRIQARVQHVNRQGPPALAAVTGGYRHGRLHPNKHHILCTVQEFNGHDPAARRAWSIASKHDSVKTEGRGLSSLLQRSCVPREQTRSGGDWDMSNLQLYSKNLNDYSKSYT